MKHINILSIVLGLFLMQGCSNQSARDFSKLNLSNVSGRITLDGIPLEKAQVIFTDNATKTYSYGTTDSSGNYSLKFDSTKNGVLPGKKTVSIWTTKKGPEFGEEESVGENGKSDTNKTETIPKKYNAESELFETVEPSKTQVFDYELLSK